MHYLMLPYTLLSGLYLLHFFRQRHPADRFGIRVAAGGTIALLFVAGVTRPVAGDAWRYNEKFQWIATQPLQSVLSEQGSDILFTLLNAAVAEISTAPAILFTATLVIYYVVFIVALRHLLPPVGASMLLMAYSMYPYFVAYAVNGVRQGLALVFLLLGLVLLSGGQRRGWLWILVAPCWHAGAWLAVAAILVHQWLVPPAVTVRGRFGILLGAFVVVSVLSFTQANQRLLGFVPVMLEVDPSHSIYFDSAANQGIAYRSGFRPDFYLFSLLPLLTDLLLRPFRDAGQRSASSWWLSMYLSLNLLYHLFSFAPFSDRFAIFSWFLIPLIVFLQVWHTRRWRLQAALVVSTTMLNLLLLQLYSGNFLLHGE